MCYNNYITFFLYSQFATNVTMNGTFCYVNGNDILHSRGYSLDWLWYDQIALGGTTLGWLLLAYIVLRIVKIYYRHFK